MKSSRLFLISALLMPKISAWSLHWGIRAGLSTMPRLHFPICLMLCSVHALYSSNQGSRSCVILSMQCGRGLEGQQTEEGI